MVKFLIGFPVTRFLVFWDFGFDRSWSRITQIFIESFVDVAFRLHSSSCFSGIDITGGRSREAGARNPQSPTARDCFLKKRKKEKGRKKREKIFFIFL